MAFTLAAMIQIWLVFQHRDETNLALADDNEDIAVAWQPLENADPFHILTNPKNGNSMSISPHCATHNYTREYNFACGWAAYEHADSIILSVGPLRNAGVRCQVGRGETTEGGWEGA